MNENGQADLIQRSMQLPFLLLLGDKEVTVRVHSMDLTWLPRLVRTTDLSDRVFAEKSYFVLPLVINANGV